MTWFDWQDDDDRWYRFALGIPVGLMVFGAAVVAFVESVLK